ncbi:hypothetical protein BCR33DRAFT_738072 [Rhizoclosmatium globosum]|uniref:Uncharacterized protein n=1 Tax=Rhizoclosmatium globosum TaxID=329046 RepID=A0A1Y2CDV3_9FUNG|nr:hypothetical protein BCR33DRAFT_738072 [Rhizoclosmatium globosum]|eukprot:ORY44485.1 hypothetical protein BCR33DRAFT_738072 [Rhizoclosmatium globosum]
MSTSMVRPRTRAALELVLRHLVFARSPPANQAPLKLDQDDMIDYYELYSDGLVYGSLVNLAAFPVAGSGSFRSQSLQSERDEAPVSEALHPLLKSVFQLDMSLMVDLCGPMTMGRVASQSISELERNGSKRLHKWYRSVFEAICDFNFQIGLLDLQSSIASYSQLQGLFSI